jgi:hypothetical protein
MTSRYPLQKRLHASCEDGWLSLLEDCLIQLESFGLQIDVVRAGEKMGVLHIRIETPTTLSAADQRCWEDIIRSTEEASMTVCEICAAPGRLRRSSTGTWATRCDEHEGM